MKTTISFRILIPVTMLILLWNTTTIAQTNAYRYVRLEVESMSKGMHIAELYWHNGAINHPKIPLHQSDDDFHAIIASSGNNFYTMADRDSSTMIYYGSPVRVDLDFKNRVIYPTGLTLLTGKWTRGGDSRISFYGSNDNSTWELLGTFEQGEGDFTVTSDNAYVSFDFGFDPVLVDLSPPSIPSNLSVTESTQSSISLNWDPSSDQSGILGYEVYLDGQFMDRLDVASLSYTFTELTPTTSYQLEVRALDNELNYSDPALLTTSTSSKPVAQPYRYFRIWLDERDGNDPLDHGLIHEIQFLEGEKAYPILPLANDASNGMVVTSSINNSVEPAWLVFDGDTTTKTYTDFPQHIMLQSQQVDIYPTGMQMWMTWSKMNKFRVEASNDGNEWIELYRNDNAAGHFENRSSGYRFAAFDFQYELPTDLDNVPPSIPQNLQINNISSGNAELSWDASVDEGVGVSAYILRVNGSNWDVSSTNSATIHGLSPEANYTIEVAAMDFRGNLSDFESTSVNTLPLTPALAPMLIGTNFGFSNAADSIFRQDANFEADENPFSTTFIDEITPYSFLRGMELSVTNNNRIANWSDRRQKSDPEQVANWAPNTQVEPAKGIAYEWQIEMSNLIGKDFWITVPHMANDDYITNLAQLIKDELDPQLNVYLEYSNEVWNPGFHQHTYANEQGLVLGFHTDGPTAGRRFYVYRSLQIYEIFENVFASQSDRVINVLAGQSGWTGVAEQHIEALEDPIINPNGIWPDYFSIAPYFGGHLDGSSPTIIEELYTEIEVAKQQVIDHYNLFNPLDIPLIAYEGGIHIVVNATGINTYPAVYNHYMAWLDAVSPYLEGMCHYAHVKNTSSTNPFNALEYTGQPKLEAYKYRALLDWQAVNGGSTGSDQPPIITEHPESVTVTELDRVVLSATVIGSNPKTFQWYKNGNPVDGATEFEIDLGLVNLENDGDTYYLVASNPYGSVTSEIAIIGVNALEKIALAEKSEVVITIDGERSGEWDNAAIYSIENVNIGTTEGGSDFSGQFSISWDEDHFYVIVEVTDDILVSDPAGPTWNFDGVEIYLDPDLSRGTSYDGINDRQYIFNWGVNTLNGGPLDGINGVSIASTDNSEGYVVEWSFDWSMMGVTPTDDMSMGFEVMIIDNDGNNRESKKAWFSNEDNSWNNPSLFGIATLQESARPFQYLRFRIDSARFMLTQEIDWLVDGTAYPTADLSSNNSGGVEVSASFNNRRAWKVYDGLENSPYSYWFTGRCSPVELTLNLLNEQVSPTAITISKPRWSRLYAFTCLGSEDGVNWVEIYSNNEAQGYWHTKTFEFGSNDPTARLELENDVIEFEEEVRITDAILYPNPAKHILNIEAEGSFQLKLIDMSGRVILTKEENDHGRIDVTNYRPGIYFLKVNDQMHKVVIE